MAIKKLQNDYTTPEQSKRLLELGVPADSADCIMKPDGSEICKWHERYPIREFVEYANNRCGYESYCYCWSFGRLMEINRMCNTASGQWNLYSNNDTRTLVEWMMDVFENSQYDFSKLEED